MTKNMGLLVILIMTFSSCSVFYGANHDISEKVKELRIGMSKEETLSIMGKAYTIESTSLEPDGMVEVIKYYSSYTPYLVHFLNDELVAFNRFYPPMVPEQKVIIKQEE